MKKKLNLLVVLLGLIIILAFVVLKVNNNNKMNQVEDKVQVVTNYSDFYTVNSCVQRVITYIALDDNKSLLLVLDDDYKSKHSISYDNVLNIFPKFDSTVTFKPQKMYYVNTSKNIVKYYVKGESSSDLSADIGETYFIINLDKKLGLFSVEPYSGKIFKEGSNE